MESDNKKTKKKTLKWILLGILTLLLGLAIVFGILLFISKNHDKNAQYLDEIKYFAKMDEGKYYIAQADPNISFWVEQKNNEYSLLDSKGEEVDSKVKVINDKYYIARELGFEEGETYTLILKNNKFLDERLMNANVVVFTIKRDEVSEYKYKDNVYEVKSEDLEIIDDELKTSSYKQGDIILIKEDEDIVDAYKVQSIDNGTAKLIKPELSEIYSEFNLYKDMKLDYSNFIMDTDTLETALAMKEQKESNKYGKASLEQVSYSIEKQLNEMPEIKYIKAEAAKTGNNVKTGIDIKTEDNKMIIEFTINVEANGESFLGIKALSKHDLEMKLTFDITHDLLVDINLAKSMSVVCKLTEGLEVNINLTNKIDHDGFTGLTDDEYDKTVQDIIARLEGAKSDTASGRATIGALEVPTGIPGVNVYFDIYFQTDTHLSLDATYNQRLETSQTMGVVFIDKSFKPFMESSQPEIAFDFNAFGKATTKLGLGMDIGLSLISKDFANINLGNEFGFYAEAYAVAHADYSSSDNPEKINSYVGGMIEAGIYFENSINANINLFFDKFNYSHNFIDERKPFLKIGEDQMVAGIKPEKYKVEVTGESAQIPIIYRQLLTFRDGGKITEEEIPTQYLKFTDEFGNDVANSGVEFNSNNEFKVTVTYEELDGNEYTTEITFINKTEQKVIRIPLIPAPTKEENTTINENISNENNEEIIEQENQEEYVEEEEELINREFTLEEAMALTKERIDAHWENSGYEEIPEFKYKFDRIVTSGDRELYAIYVYTEEDINMKYASADWKEAMPDGSGYHYMTYLVQNRVIDNIVYYYTEYNYEDYSDGINHYLIQGPGFTQYYDITLTKEEQPVRVNIFGY